MGGYLAYAEYKDSGVEWLGKVPSHWQVKRLKDSASYNDEALDEDTDPDYEIEYIDISSVDLVEGITHCETLFFEKAPSRARRKVRNGDTIVSTVRTYLKSITAIRNPPANMIVSTGFAVVRPKATLEPDYIGYLLQSEGFVGVVVANSVGVSYPAINASVLARLPVVEPPIEEQRSIARFLDYKTAQIDALIAKKETLLKKLAEKRTALISQAVTKGCDRTVPMKDSGIEWLGEIPAHWNASRLKYVTHLIIDGTHVTPTYLDEGIPFLRVTDIVQADTKEINLDNAKFISEEEHKILSKRSKPQKGDLLYSKNGTIGVVRVVNWDFEFSIFVSLCLIKMVLP
jgi:type I restriction enzyme S subunit